MLRKSDSGLDRQFWKVTHMNMRRSQQGPLVLQKGMSAQKAHAKEGRPPPSSEGGIPVPSHWSGQGTHSSRLANWKQIVTGRRGKEGGGGCPRQSRNEME